jgi:hypothetical protein
VTTKPSKRQLGLLPATGDNAPAVVLHLDYMNASPQLILALLRQLVHEAGVRPRDNAVGYPLGLFPNQYYGYLHREFPNVRYLDHDGGNANHPLTRVQYSSVLFYWSSLPTGTAQDYVSLRESQVLERT